ncbi:LPS translocon maturation chaperone LptM [Umboniibacter marinipuniceus]|uniref:Putative lipoprotein n=1 Tax=Umboniibacter marinipuniceus TaxID=569599 RepID=A0A3M0ATE4_9GAMM|nr:putative lipoprotein [Umboniibacter marinipuniceus]
MFSRRNITMFILLGLLAACGQKGPLYLPEEDASHITIED